jgi:hypothetical protein
LDAHPHIQAFRLSYVCGDASIRKAQIVDDPTGAINPVTGRMNRVLHFWLKDTCHDGAETRVSTGIKPNHQLTEVFSRVRMYVHPDIERLRRHSSGVSNSELHWLQIHEFWARHDSEGAQSFRVNVDLVRTRETGTFYWGAEGSQNGPRVVYWERTNTSVPVPFGEWVTTEMYYKMGDRNTGRFMFAIQRAGQPKQTLFDVTDWTYHPDRAPEGLHTWNPHKLYTDPRNVDFVRNDGGIMQIFWDDWEVWTTRPPAITMGDLDGDGAVTAADLRLLTRMLLGQAAPSAEAKSLAAPVDQLTLADARALLYLLMP